MTAPTLIVPVKALTEGKSRLGGILDAEERVALNRRFLDHILSVAVDFPGPASTWVVSNDPEILTVARDRGVNTVAEGRDCGLNGALTIALAEIDPAGEADILVLHADLPNVTAEDARALCQAPLALAPDGRDEGTNGLYMANGVRIPFRFGMNSFERHLSEARSQGIEPAVIRRQGLAFDVDTSAEYSRFNADPDC